jgi:hypothetical protein
MILSHARTYLVKRDGWYLRLDGPFEYPRWGSYGAATQLRAAKASQLAGYLGGLIEDYGAATQALVGGTAVRLSPRLMPIEQAVEISGGNED